MALGQMQQGRFDAALQDLMRVVSRPELRVPRMANGWLYVLAKTLERQGQSDVAALVALAGLNLEKELQWIIHDLKPLVHSRVHIRPDGAGLGVFHDPGAVLEWLQATPDLLQILESNLGMPPGIFMERYQVPRQELYSLIRLVAEQKTAGPLSLAIAALQGLKPADLQPGQAAGLAYWAKGNTAAPVQDRLAILRLLDELSPNNLAVMYELADFLKTSGVFFEAADVQARAVGLNPRHSGARRQFAELLVLTGESGHALAEAATAFELNAHPHHLWLLAYLHALNGNLEAGRDMVRTLAVERNFPVDYQRLPDFDATVAKLVSLPELLHP
jgi:tetratricopeptide (TPR) repeat protein